MEVFVAWWKYYPGIRSGLRKTMKNFRISGVHAEVRISWILIKSVTTTLTYFVKISSVTAALQLFVSPPDLWYQWSFIHHLHPLCLSAYSFISQLTFEIIIYYALRPNFDHRNDRLLSIFIPYVPPPSPRCPTNLLKKRINDHIWDMSIPLHPKLNQHSCKPVLSGLSDIVPMQIPANIVRSDQFFEVSSER